MHRNSQKRIYGEQVYFITCDVKDSVNFFEKDLFCELWLKELKLAKHLLRFKLHAFCLNRNHFHMLIQPDDNFGNYSDIMGFLKKNFSRDVNTIMGYNNFNSILTYLEGDDPNHRPNYKHICDDWDRRLQHHKQFLCELRIKFIELSPTPHNIPKFKWQKSFYDHIIRGQKDYDYHWNYTMNNFLKHDLPRNWKYTGLRYPEMIDDL